MKRYLTTALLTFCLALLSSAETFNKQSYYSAANGKKGAALKTALCNIINPHTTISYSGLLSVYHKTDVTNDGYIWDMYSNITRYIPGGPAENHQYSKEGDSYNREHSVPQSWFDERSPMKSDVYHVIPTDGYVNNRRSNYDFGEVANVSWQSNGGFSKVGSPTSQLKADGCNCSTVFEPNDMYKGDFARIYFYMATCYENEISSWGSNNTFGNSKYPGFTSWALKMFMNWANNDPVSKKETDRVAAAFEAQDNRNPFVDFPGLEKYIWGTWQDSTFSVANYVIPYEMDNENGEGDGDEDSKDDENTTPLGDYALVTSNLQDWEGTYLIVYESGSTCCAFDGGLSSMDAANNVITVSIADDVIKSTERTDASSFTIKNTETPGIYSIQGKSGKYIGKASAKNGLDTSDTYDETLGNSISVSLDGYANIKAKCGYVLRYNNAASSGNRFRYYKEGNQLPIKLYRKSVKNLEDEDGILPEAISEDIKKNAPLYDLMGRKVTHPSKGLYIREGKKSLLR